MSEESNIAATALLPALLGVSANGAGQTGSQRSLGTQFLQSDGKPDTFSELLSSNIDGITDHNNPFTAQTGFGPDPSQPLTSSRGINDYLRRSLSLESQSLQPPTNSGKVAPEAGDFLPLETDNEAATNSAELFFNGEGVSSEIYPARSMTQASGESGDDSESLFGEADGTFKYASANSLTDPSEGTVNDSLSEAVHVGQYSSAGSSSSTGATSDNNPTLRRDALGSTGLDGAQSSFSGQASDDQMPGEGDLPQQGQIGDQDLDSLVEERASERTVAEFAVNNKRSSATNNPTPTSVVTSAELGATPTSTLQQTTLSAPTVPTATLALAADRNLAGQQVAQQVAAFVRQGDDSAELNLTPPHLGKISLRITVQNDQASVVLSALLPEIREVIESSLPRLGELLEDAGLNLANAEVTTGQQQANENNAGSEDNHGDIDVTESSSNGDANAVEPEINKQTLGLVDAYA